jgi:formylglycine-generating enzyme required for sulfatase activity
VRVPGGFFAPDYDGVDSTSTERRRVKVSPYLLDKYEVTVGRFRAFVKATTDAKAPWKPAKASGKHGHLSNGKGLVSTSNASLYEPGWRTVYDGALPSTLEKWTTQLRCDLLPTWTSTEGTAKEEERPINCVTWPMAYAFCIYDGGFLPSDFEWNYAASGGEAEYRYYPWSVPANSQAIDIALASYGDNGDVCRGDGLPACVLEDIFPVGTKTGKGRWGQADLGGNVAEWTLDKDNVRNALCNDCSNFDPTLDVNRRVRGGSLRSSPAELRAAASAGRSSTVANDNLGFRCARSPAP